MLEMPHGKATRGGNTRWESSNEVSGSNPSIYLQEEKVESE